MTELMTSPRWMDKAACQNVDPEIFFPRKGEMDKLNWARRICRGDEEKNIPACPVLVECLHYAMVNLENHGVWGGTTDRERQILRRELDDDDGDDVGVAA